MRRALSTLIASALMAGCDDRLPPLPEVVVVADTDLPVPLVASRLRVDLFSEGGAWFESADFARPDPRDWPVSFGVYSDDPSRSRRVWVRLRAYVDGRTRDYRGESPFLLGGPIEHAAAATDAPRLLRDGDDITPDSEPDPLDAVDRLLLIELEPDTRAEVRAGLHGECIGTSALFGADPARLTSGEAQTCVATEKTRQTLSVAHAVADAGRAGPSVQGSWLAEPACGPPDPASARVCVPGGATVLGASDPTSNTLIPALPIRALGLRPFHLDRDEVSVGRFRDAMARGFVPTTMPFANNGPLAATAVGYCTWSTEPMDREDYSLGCVKWFTGREFCRFEGGDLPTETQWEHAATIAGHGTKVHYPWGDDPPDCGRAAYGRRELGGEEGECMSLGLLAPPPADSQNDLTPLGIRALGGGLSEWVLDVPAPYDAACWGDSPIVDPLCGDPDAPAAKRIIRGSSFISSMVFSTSRVQQDPDGGFGPVGFRCAYAEAGP